MLGKQAGRTLFMGAAVVIAIGAGVGAGRLPIWDQIAHRTSQATQGSAVHAAAATTRGQAFQPIGAGRAASQGLKVHGWWTIKVLDHGRVVINRQFENSLVTNAVNGNGGDTALALLLGREDTAGPWKLDTADPNGALIFVLSSASNAPENGPLNIDADNLEPGHVILSGQYTPSTTVTIAAVNTFLFLCGNSTAPANCTSTALANQTNFTSAALVPANQVTVNGGQVVQIKVDFSFS